MNRISEEQIDRLMLLVQKQANDLSRLLTAPTWYEVTSFSNSWVNYGTWAGAAYCKDVFGFVHLRGLIKSGTVGTPGSESEAFTLPFGYRPATMLLFGTISNGAIGRVDILTDGKVAPLTPSNNTYVALDGITFYAG